MRESVRKIKEKKPSLVADLGAMLLDKMVNNTIDRKFDPGQKKKKNQV